MARVWQFIGFFGPSAVDDIPKVMPGAVMDPQGRRVVVIDLAEDEATLQNADYMTLAHFEECVADGVATKLESPAPWAPKAILLLVEGKIERLMVDEADARMVAFVRQQRMDGTAALERGERKLALECFYRASRVSSEREDIERVVEGDATVEAIRTWEGLRDWVATSRVFRSAGPLPATPLTSNLPKEAWMVARTRSRAQRPHGDAASSPSRLNVAGVDPTMSDEELSPEDLRRGRERALACVEHFVDDYMYYDRKGDEDLPVGRLETLIARGALKPEEVVEAFRAALVKTLERLSCGRW